MTGKTVLITGAAQRIGAAIARDLHDHDMDVVIHYHQSSLSAEKLAAELNQMRKESAFLVQGDLLDFTCYEEIIERIEDKGNQETNQNVGSKEIPKW